VLESLGQAIRGRRSQYGVAWRAGGRLSAIGASGEPASDVALALSLRSVRANCYWRHRVWSVCTYPNRPCGAVRAVLLLLNDSPARRATRRRD